MLLKRLYNAAKQPVGVVVKHTGIAPEQNFSTKMVARAMAEGWMVIEGDQLLLMSENGILRYTIKRVPGYYCVHNGQPMNISAAAYADGSLAAIEARSYLASHGFAGVASPDPSKPAGYERINHYECVLDLDQHAKLRAIPGALAPSTAPVEV